MSIKNFDAKNFFDQKNFEVILKNILIILCTEQQQKFIPGGWKFPSSKMFIAYQLTTFIQSTHYELYDSICPIHLNSGKGYKLVIDYQIYRISI